jgi:hypothetical protein
VVLEPGVVLVAEEEVVATTNLELALSGQVVPAPEPDSSAL